MGYLKGIVAAPLFDAALARQQRHQLSPDSVSAQVSAQNQCSCSDGKISCFTYFFLMLRNQKTSGF